MKVLVWSRSSTFPLKPQRRTLDLTQQDHSPTTDLIFGSIQWSLLARANSSQSCEVGLSLLQLSFLYLLELQGEDQDKTAPSTSTFYDRTSWRN